LSATHYENEIVSGFRRGWRCLLGTPTRRAALRRRLQHLLGQERRRIYWSSKNYDAIRRASIQPAALRTGVDRRMLIARSCTRNAVCQTVIRKEISALKRLDIPYFTLNRNTWRSLPKDNTAPVELAEALQKAVHL